MPRTAVCFYFNKERNLKYAGIKIPRLADFIIGLRDGNSRERGSYDAALLVENEC
mgnify:CR=1 FL=1